MENLSKLLKSRQFWTIVVLFVVNGVGGVREFVPAEVLPALNALLGVLTVYFRVKPVQKFK